MSGREEQHSSVTIETKMTLRRHAAATARDQKEGTSRSGFDTKESIMVHIEKATLRTLMAVAVALGCSASVLSGMLTVMSVPVA
jgi:hypothetical protein